jgi:hypothetical protein
VALVLARDRLGRRARRRHGPRQDDPDDLAALGREGRRRQDRGGSAVQGPHRRADEVVTNWMREIERFAPSLKAVAWTGPDREKRTPRARHADVVITSYALLRRDEDFFQKYEFAVRHPRRGAEHQEPPLGHGARGEEAPLRSAASRSRARPSRTASRRSGRSSTSCRRGCSATSRPSRSATRAPSTAATRRPRAPARGDPPAHAPPHQERGGQGPPRAHRGGARVRAAADPAAALPAGAGAGAGQRARRDRPGGRGEEPDRRSSRGSRGCARRRATRGSSSCRGSSPTTTRASSTR